MITCILCELTCRSVNYLLRENAAHNGSTQMWVTFYVNKKNTILGYWKFTEVKGQLGSVFLYSWRT